LRVPLSVCAFLPSDALAQTILEGLGSDHHQVTRLQSRKEFCIFLSQEKQQVDCLILQDDPELPPLANWLHGQAILLPAVLVSYRSDIVDALPQQSVSREPAIIDIEANQTNPPFLYHNAEIRVGQDELAHLDDLLNRAIFHFLSLSPACRLQPLPPLLDTTPEVAIQNLQNFLMFQQHRLTDKLKERLGYLGVYYKRNPKNFLRHLPPTQKQELLDRLRAEYQEIILHYFSNYDNLNQQIDNFVNTAFFADVPVAQIVEIHMELMDEFSKQLKLEGRSEEILLDYRLTLIDTIAHLCEMYRRSIPRES
jgi:circadian clock protein KaiA